MKMLFGMLILCLSANSFAKDLTCNLESKFEYEFIEPTFALFGIEQKYPEISGFDGGNMASGDFQFSYSNECDNSMEIEFNQFELAAVIAGENSKISGKMYYISGETEEYVSDAVSIERFDNLNGYIATINCVVGTTIEE